MQIPKPSDSDKERFRSLVPEGDAVEVKPMFGNLGAFVNGNMFAGLFGPSLGVRLVEDASREELAAVDGTGPFGPEERPMGGYVALPADWTTSQELASSWMARAMSEVGALPPKAAKPAKKAAKKPTT
jgi:TfoX/Sxy family transcriptional regulator of competence genes